MGEKANSRSGYQVASNVARAVKAAYRIIKAALSKGWKGAVVAAAKEALPFLLKLVLVIVCLALFIPMLIYTLLPNMFFGFSSSGTDSVIELTDQAMAVGGAYMSLEDFERNQMDTYITSLVSDYEREGTSISKIEVTNEMDKDDLYWIIAINSTANKQDLRTMSAESVQSFCAARLSYITSLISGESSNVLTVRIGKLKPEEVMDELGFDEEAKAWAGALYEVLSGSDALTLYGDQFDQYRPSYSGDTSYTGGVQYGTEYNNEIDISKFVSPGTKNNRDLAAYALQAWENNWGYVWGTYGNVLTESLFEYKLEQYPDGVGGYKEFIEEHWLGRRTTDCVGLIKGYGWLDVNTLKLRYAANGMPDYGADQMFKAAKSAGVEDVDYGSMDSMPEIVGLAVWKSGHIGVYIGGGKVVEAMGTKKGVVMTEVAGRGWSGWCKLPYIDYI